MQKTTKKLLGLVGLALVMLLTIVAYLLPTNGVYAEGVTAGTDTLIVTVYNINPSIKINEPETDYLTTSPALDVDFTYENAAYVDFTLTYIDENGATQTVALPRFEPENLDPTYGVDSDTKRITINLHSVDIGSGETLDYNHYVLSVVSGGPVGESGGDSIEFDYVPAILNQTGTDENTNDPIVEIENDEGVAKVEIMPIDSEGNPLLDEPFVVTIQPNGSGEYPAGTQTVTLPYTANGLDTGEYMVKITSYNAEEEELYSTKDIYDTEYEQPEAPEAPNTGALLEKLNIAETDYAITIAIVFAAVSAIAFRFLIRKKKDYRKNISRRK